MCAAADIRRIPNGGAHWLRPTVVLPTPHPMSRTAPSNPVIARSGATWQSVLLLHRTSNLCVGAGFYPAYLPRISNHAPVGRHPCVPPPIDRRTPQKCHCAPVTDVTGAAIRLPFFTHPFRPFAQKSKPKLCKTEKPKNPLRRRAHNAKINLLIDQARITGDSCFLLRKKQGNIPAPCPHLKIKK